MDGHENLRNLDLVFLNISWISEMAYDSPKALATPRTEYFMSLYVCRGTAEKQY